MALSQRKNFYIPVPRYASSTKDASEGSKSRTSSFSTTKEETSPPVKVVPSKGKKKPIQAARSLRYTNRFGATKKTKQEIRKLKMDMAFDNETGLLATRCDVVYKTILRDFRRYFLDEYKAFKSICKQDWGSTQSLVRFTSKIYPEKSVKEVKELSLDLGCLLFPKELVKDQKALKEIQKVGTFGEEIETIQFEIMRIHGFLYKFSIDKIEECFQNISLCELFLTYVEATRETRIGLNPTMKKNSSIYLKARKILEDKASGSLFHTSDGEL